MFDTVLLLLRFGKFFVYHLSELVERRARCQNCAKQAETGPSYRHIAGSKIAKGLQNVKVSGNWGPFYEKKLKKISKCRKH